MINLSKRARTCGTLKQRFFGYYDPELYLAEDIKDYRNNREKITAPMRSCLQILPYAYILFYNVSIDAIIDDTILVNQGILEKYVHVHDKSGLKVMSWNNTGDMLPAEKPYFQMLEEGELRPKDHVYSLIIRHAYESLQPFIAEVTKFRPTKIRGRVECEELDLSGVTFALP